MEKAFHFSLYILSFLICRYNESLPCYYLRQKISELLYSVNCDAGTISSHFCVVVNW